MEESEVHKTQQICQMRYLLSVKGNEMEGTGVHMDHNKPLICLQYSELVFNIWSTYLRLFASPQLKKVKNGRK